MTYKDNKNFLLINSLVQEKKFFEAKEILLKDKSKYLLDYFFLYILGFLEDQLGNSNQAISNYLESVRLNPSFKESKFSLGSIYYKLRNLREYFDYFILIILISWKLNYTAGLNNFIEEICYVKS